MPIFFDEAGEKRLKQFGVIVLPEELEHDTYALLLEALLLLPGREIKLYCRGNGGSNRSALAMVDLIRQHGNVTGLLAGEAASSHAVVWAGCTRRFVYPFGGMSIHRVAWASIDTRVDANYARLLTDEYMRADRQTAELLAEISTVSISDWYHVIERTGSGIATFYDASELIKLGIARPISEYVPDSVTGIIQTASPESGDGFMAALLKAQS